MENSSYVEQGTYKFRDKSLGPLITGGLATCSAISLTINDNDIFMTHIDAKTDVIKIAKDIKQLYPDLLQFTNVKIWYGGGMGVNDSTITQKLIGTLTQHLAINITPFKESSQDIIIHTQNNQIIQCIVGNIDKSQVICYIGEPEVSPVEVYLFKHHHVGNPEFIALKNNDIINVKIGGSKWEYNDTCINSIAQFVNLV